MQGKIMSRIPDGEKFRIPVHFGAENGYFVRNNLIYSYWIDLKEMQEGESKTGQTVEQFLKDPEADPRAKQWIKELLLRFKDKK